VGLAEVDGREERPLRIDFSENEVDLCVGIDVGEAEALEPPSDDVARLRLGVDERGVIGDVLRRFGGRFARSPLSVAQQLKRDDPGAHAQ